MIVVSNNAKAAEWLLKEMGRAALSGLFHRSGELVSTALIGEDGYMPAKKGSDDGPAKIKTFDHIDLKTIVENRHALGVAKESTKEVINPKTGEPETKKAKYWEPRMFPNDSAIRAYRSALSLDGTPNLRVLKGVTHTPLVREDGSILNVPGYDTATQNLYLPETGLRIFPVSDNPTAVEVVKAVDLIESIVEEFMFVEDFHRANWFGALFTPLMRTMLKPPYPVVIMNAPAAGSGKSYLADIIKTVHGGILRPGFAKDEAEFAKSALGILTDTTAPVIIFDNVRGKIKNAKFEALLTSDTFTDRLLGQNREATGINDRLWVITANNAEIDGDLARRTYWVSIDPKTPHPEARTGFKLDLTTWVPEHRAEIIHAMLTIITAWVKAGAPKAARKRSDSYATWDSSMEGMLAWAGFKGQFGAVDVKHRESSGDAEFEVFLNAVHEALGSSSFKAADLTQKIADQIDSRWDDDGDGSGKIDSMTLPGELADKWSKSGNSKAHFAKSLGRWFSNRDGRYFGDLVVRMTPDKKRGNSFRVVNYKDERATK